jgi:hypothetical protein
LDHVLFSKTHPLISHGGLSLHVKERLFWVKYFTNKKKLQVKCFFKEQVLAITV